MSARTCRCPRGARPYRVRSQGGVAGAVVEADGAADGHVNELRRLGPLPPMRRQQRRAERAAARPLAADVERVRVPLPFLELARQRRAVPQLLLPLCVPTPLRASA